MKISLNNVDYDMSSPTSENYKKRLIESLGDEYKKEHNVSVLWSHVDGFQLNLESEDDLEYLVKIFDGDNVLLYETFLKNNMFCKLSRKYYNGIRYEIYNDTNELIISEIINFEGKTIFISFDSASLGDTIAWIPYCEVFRKLNKCNVIVSTFKNFLFEKSYPNLTFVNPGEIVNNIHGMFNIGWFYDSDKEPQNPQTIQLQKAICNIIGIPFIEQVTNIDFTPKERPIKEKYITIATSSTAGCKLWNYPDGWFELINYLKGQGFRVINISKEEDNISNSEQLLNNSLENTMNFIHHSEFFIGLSSGLSWLTWAMKKHVVMISNFTLEDHEFITNCTRIVNKLSCNGCWNNPNFKFDKGDWYWCPEHKDTERQFECHKTISPSTVIESLQKLL